MSAGVPDLDGSALLVFLAWLIAVGPRLRTLPHCLTS
jgi:hypothetical protein